MFFVRIGGGWAHTSYGFKWYHVFTSILKSMIQSVCFMLNDKCPLNLPPNTPRANIFFWISYFTQSNVFSNLYSVVGNPAKKLRRSGWTRGDLRGCSRNLPSSPKSKFNLNFLKPNDIKRQTSFALQAIQSLKSDVLYYVRRPKIKIKLFTTFHMKFKEPRILEIWCKSIRGQWIMGIGFCVQIFSCERSCVTVIFRYDRLRFSSIFLSRKILRVQVVKTFLVWIVGLALLHIIY